MDITALVIVNILFDFYRQLFLATNSKEEFKKDHHKP